MTEMTQRLTTMQESKAKIELGRTKTVEGFEFYIGSCSVYIARDEHLPRFFSSYTAYSTNFSGKICLTGFDIRPTDVLNYKAMCEHYARRIGEEMKRNGITFYEVANGNPNTGIVFDTRIERFTDYSNAGAKMDTIPEDGIELFKKTLEECLRE